MAPIELTDHELRALIRSYGEQLQSGVGRKGEIAKAIERAKRFSDELQNREESV